MGYVGADSFPEDVTLPTDAPPLSAAILNVPNEANLDRTRWLFRRDCMRIPAGFERMIAMANAHATHRTGRPGYSVRRQRWYIGPGSSALTTTEDCGGTLVNSASLVDECGYHVAFINAAGNARYGNGIFVPLKTSLIPQGYTHSTDAYAAMASNLPNATWGGVLHEPIADTWVVWYVGKIYTSPTAAIAWTDRSALPGGGVMGIIPIASNGAGLLMAHGKIKGVYTSNDGGVTWVECTTAFGLLTITSITWDAWRGRFLVTLSDGAGLAETWWSTDGGAWAMLATGIDFAAPPAPAPAGYVFEVLSVGPVLIGTLLAATGAPVRLVYSIDGGVRWGRAPSPVFGPTDSPVYLATNGADVLAVNLDTDYRKIAFSRGFAPIVF